jgi:hypothetical protein
MARKTPPITERLSLYLDNEAERRYEQALNDLDDDRDMRSAQKLSEFAFYVADLPDDDARLVKLRLIQAPNGTDAFAATAEGSRFVGRIGLDLGTYEQSPDVLLDLLVDIECRGLTNPSPHEMHELADRDCPPTLDRKRRSTPASTVGRAQETCESRGPKQTPSQRSSDP